MPMSDSRVGQSIGVPGQSKVCHGSIVVLLLSKFQSIQSRGGDKLLARVLLC